MNVETNLVIALLLYIFAGVVVSEPMLKKMLRNTHLPSWDRSVAIAIAFTYSTLFWPLVLVYIHKNISFIRTTLLFPIILLMHNWLRVVA
jgi:hypothetical protein